MILFHRGSISLSAEREDLGIRRFKLVALFWQCWVIILIGIVSLIFQPIVGGLIIFVGLLVGLRKFIEYKTSEFAVTTKRVIIKVGVFRRRTLELLLRQVEAISVEQTVLGRMLGFGSVTLTGTGGVREVFHNISSPLEFRRQIHSQAT
ncbi:MAG: PH domain-containing protein [Deltaproteobacteria bacterium]|nr:MAG: PH domain-containing protein [Deltaproteobacteria bacterium]